MPSTSMPVGSPEGPKSLTGSTLSKRSSHRFGGLKVISSLACPFVEDDRHPVSPHLDVMDV